MNKLTKDLIYEIAVQGRDKNQWNKALETFESKETRTPWKQWIEYRCSRDSWNIYDVRGHFEVPVEGRPSGWEIVIDQETFPDPTVYVRALIRADSAPSAPIIIGFVFTGQRDGPKLTFQGTHWLAELIPMCNRLVSKKDYTFFFRVNKDPYPFYQTRIYEPEDFHQVLAKLEPEVLEGIIRAILGSGLDFYPEPVLQLLKTCQELGIKYKP